jgi:hypothetical protein
VDHRSVEEIALVCVFSLNNRLFDVFPERLALLPPDGSAKHKGRVIVIQRSFGLIAVRCTVLLGGEHFTDNALNEETCDFIISTVESHLDMSELTAISQKLLGSSFSSQ